MPERRALGLDLLRSNFLWYGGTGGQQLSAQLQTGNPKAIGQEPEVTDANEPFGQHVQKEATQELRGGQGHLTGLATVGVILPPESHALLFEGQQAMIGNGHAMGVAPEIAQHLQGTTESGLSIDHPVVTCRRRISFANCRRSARAAAGPTNGSSLRQWRRFRPARNLPRKMRLRTLTGKKKG